MAMVNLFDKLEIIDKSSRGQYIQGKNIFKQIIFPYGDVLTIKKWYALVYTILQQTTSIGKEDYVEIMMMVYKQFFKMQYYLHENIYHLQVIYKLFYSRFIQLIQVLLGSKKVNFDPTKGLWKQHEYHMMRNLFAIQRLCTKYFLWEHGLDLLIKMVTGKVDHDGMWQLQEEYCKFVASLGTVEFKKTRIVALFAKLTSSWLGCHRSVSVRDSFVLKVEGCEWLEVWIAMDKPNYLLEGKGESSRFYILRSGSVNTTFKID